MANPLTSELPEEQREAIDRFAQARAPFERLREEADIGARVEIQLNAVAYLMDAKAFGRAFVAAINNRTTLPLQPSERYIIGYLVRSEAETVTLSDCKNYAQGPDGRATLTRVEAEAIADYRIWR